MGRPGTRHPIAAAEEALELLPDAQLRVLPGTGFLIAYDDPVGVAREIAAFCAWGWVARLAAWVSQHRSSITSRSSDSQQGLWGGETTKAVDNFPISGEPVPVEVIHWLGRIKAAAARVNGELGLLDRKLRRARSPTPPTRSAPATTTSSSRSTSSRPARAPRRT